MSLERPSGCIRPVGDFIPKAWRMRRLMLRNAGCLGPSMHVMRLRAWPACKDGRPTLHPTNSIVRVASSALSSYKSPNTAALMGGSSNSSSSSSAQSAVSANSSSNNGKAVRKLVLVDGHSVAYRCYWALNKSREGGLKTTTGIPTSITSGFIKTLHGVLQQEQPDAVAVAFDQGPSFRHLLSTVLGHAQSILDEGSFIQLVEQLRAIMTSRTPEATAAPAVAATSEVGAAELLEAEEVGLECIRSVVSEALLPEVERALPEGLPLPEQLPSSKYKLGRRVMGPDFKVDMVNLRRLLAAMRVRTLSGGSLEADDIISGLAHAAADAGCTVKIVTGDKDLLQLVDDMRQVSVLYLGGAGFGGAKKASWEELHEEGVKGKMGVPLEQVLDFKALVGDSSDNLVGVKGIGEVTAMKLLSQFGSLEGIYSNLDKLRPAERSKLMAGRASAHVTRLMAVLGGRLYDAGAVGLEACRLRGFQREHLQPLLEDLQLYGLEKDLWKLQIALGGEVPNVSYKPLPPPDYSLLQPPPQQQPAGGSNGQALQAAAGPTGGSNEENGVVAVAAGQHNGTGASSTTQQQQQHHYQQQHRSSAGVNGPALSLSGSGSGSLPLSFSPDSAAPAVADGTLAFSRSFDDLNAMSFNLTLANDVPSMHKLLERVKRTYSDKSHVWTDPVVLQLHYSDHTTKSSHTTHLGFDSTVMEQVNALMTSVDISLQQHSTAAAAAVGSTGHANLLPGVANVIYPDKQVLCGITLTWLQPVLQQQQQQPSSGLQPPAEAPADKVSTTSSAAAAAAAAAAAPKQRGRPRKKQAAAAAAAAPAAADTAQSSANKSSPQLEIGFIPVDMSGAHPSNSSAISSSSTTPAPYPSTLGAVVSELASLMCDPSIPKVLHNSKDWHHLMMAQLGTGSAAPKGGRIQGVVMDTLMAAYVLNPDLKPDITWIVGSYNVTPAKDFAGHLNSAALRMLKQAMAGTSLHNEPFHSTSGGSDQDAGSSSSSTAGQLQGIMGCLQASPAALQLWLLQQQLVQQLQQLPQRSQQLLQQTEQPLQGVLADMEAAGMLLDLPALQSAAQEVEATLQQIERRCHEVAGEPFNVSSPKQLSAVLFDKLHLPTAGIKKNTNGFSTNVEVLEKLQDKHPLVPLVMEYRELSKFRSTTLLGMQSMVRPDTQRVHTTFNQTGTSTGRLSSQDPNLQNVPSRGELGKRVRAMFVAQPGWTLLAADYSQVELRILAHLAKDPVLVEAFRAHQDVHRMTAQRLFGAASMDEVTDEQRRMAKTVNFGVIYGMGARALQQSAGLKSLKEASKFIDSFKATFPAIMACMEASQKQAITQGYVETLFGRRRYFSFAAPSLTVLRGATAADVDLAAVTKGLSVRDAHLLKAAGNAPIQGACADLIKRAMVAVAAELQAAGLQTRLLLTVHDELVFEVAPGESQAARQIIQRCMEDAAGSQLSVPLTVNIAEGHSWAHAS